MQASMLKCNALCKKQQTILVSTSYIIFLKRFRGHMTTFQELYDEERMFQRIYIMI